MVDDTGQTPIDHLKDELEHCKLQTALMLQLSRASLGTGDTSHVISRSLEALVTSNNWVLGQFWTVSEQENTARCSELYFSVTHVPEFRNASIDRRITKGIELPGRVWFSGLPILLPDVSLEAGLQFTRQGSARRCGLKSGFAFAIKNGPITMGVFEFFDVHSIKMTQADIFFYEKLGVYISTLIAQKENEDTARQMEDLFRIVLQHASNAFVAINEAGLIVQWSSRATDLFGWDQAEALGKALVDMIIPERYKDAHIKGIFRYMATKEGPVLNKRVKAPALRKDGNEISVELRIFPVQTTNVRLFGAFIVDCTDEPKEPDIVLT